LRVTVVVFVVAAAVALTAATLALAKDDARARLTTPLPLGAKTGEMVRVGWKVYVPDGNGGQRPFGAGRMFVRLLSRKGAAPTIAFTDTDKRGLNRTRARVPVGGVGGVRIGLRGTTDIVFPLENDPFTSPSGVRCDVAAVRTMLTSFVGAYNRGDLRRLDKLFSRERFLWYSWGRNARSDRAALVPNLDRRYERGDRLRSLTYRFSGYDRARDLAHFELQADRRADDLQGGSWFSMAGKGALDCSSRPVTIALLFLGAT
jgi:hypothetical protein